MGIRAQRRNRLAGLFAGLALAMVPTTCLAAIVTQPSEQIDGFWTLAEIGTNDPAAITEVIDYHFATEPKRGIYRDVPGLEWDAPFTVSSRTAPDDVAQTIGANGWTRIRIGNPNVTITGRHRYEIGYPISLSDNTNGGAFAWNAVGTQWTVPVHNVEAHVVAPVELLDATCSVGETGAWDGCTTEEVEPGHLVVRIDEINPGEGITIGGRLGAPVERSGPLPTAPALVIPEPEDRPPLFLIPLIGLAAALPGLGWMTRRVRRKGREAIWAGGSADVAFGPLSGEGYGIRYVDATKLADMASTEFVPPKEVTAWQGGALHRESRHDDHLVAWLLEQIAAGHIEVATEEEGWLFKKDTLTLTRGNSTPAPDDERILHAMFGGERRSINLSEYDEQFAAGWSTLSKSVDKWLTEAPFWDPRGDDRKTAYDVVGTLATAVGGIIALVGAAAGMLFSPWALAAVGFGVLVAALGFAAVVNSGELRVRTPEGSGLWVRIESFRRFIEKSEARHVEEAATAGRLREYSAWAAALGEADRWSDAVGQADLEPRQAAEAVYFAGLGSHLHSSTHSATTQPSSSGSGGGFGGSVGGGGGGGGGGSW